MPRSLSSLIRSLPDSRIKSEIFGYAMPSIPLRIAVTLSKILIFSLSSDGGCPATASATRGKISVIFSWISSNAIIFFYVPGRSSLFVESSNFVNSETISFVLSEASFNTLLISSAFFLKLAIQQFFISLLLDSIKLDFFNFRYVTRGNQFLFLCIQWRNNFTNNPISYRYS